MTWKSAREFIIGPEVVKALEVVEVQAAERAALVEDLLVRPALKYNENHDERGRFASGGGGGGAKAPAGGLKGHGWKAKPGRGGVTVYTHPDYPEERLRVYPDGRWRHSDDDGLIGQGKGDESLQSHLGYKKKSLWETHKAAGPMIDGVRQETAPRKRTRIL